MSRHSDDDLPFRVVRCNGTDEVLARASNLVIARAAFGAAVGMYPDDLIHLCNRALIIQKSREQ